LGNQVSNQPSPITDLEHPFAFSVSDGAVGRTQLAWLLLVLNAKGCSKSVIGDG